MEDKVAIRKGKGKKSKSVIHIMKVGTNKSLIFFSHAGVSTNIFSLIGMCVA